MENVEFDENEKLRKIIANNLLYYRKNANITQAELAEKLMYSDKNISRWERGESLPEVTVLKKMADIYGITINDFLIEEHKQQQEFVENKKRHKTLNKKQVLITLLSVSLVWLVAMVTFFIVYNFIPSLQADAWKVFIIALPISCIVALVFTSLWCTNLLNCIVVSMLIWLMATALYICIPFEAGWFFFLLAIPIQVLAILWFIFKKINFLQKIKESQQLRVNKVKKNKKDKLLNSENQIQNQTNIVDEQDKKENS